MIDFTDNVSIQSNWDTKSDFKTGKRYYVNSNFIKHNGLEDPLIAYKKIQSGETLSLQTYSSSSARNSPAHFFHINQDMNLSSGRPSPVFGRSYSPLMGSNAIHYHAHKIPDLSAMDNSVIRIKSLFPTVNETHIKALLHKYHHRENLVVSALQVEKHPLTTPGPYSYPIATAAKHIAAQFMPSSNGSPSKFISSTIRSLSPKSIRSSPKLKLRYLKNVFPVVEETILLDTLSNSENNVHKATQRLQTMGFNKRDTFSCSPHISANDTKIKSSDHKVGCDQIIIPLHETPVQGKFGDDKHEIARRLQDKFEKVSERVILLALEAVEYDIHKAEQILSVSITNDSEATNGIANGDGIKDGKKSSDNLYGHPPPAEDTKSLDKKSDILENNRRINDANAGNQIEVNCKELQNSTISSDDVTLKTADAGESSSIIANTQRVIIEINSNVTMPEVPQTITTSQYGGFKETVNRLFNNIFRNGKIIIGSNGNNDRIIPRGPNKSWLSKRCAAKGPNSALRVGPNSEHRKSSKDKTVGNNLFTTYIAFKSLSSSH